MGPPSGPEACREIWQENPYEPGEPVQSGDYVPMCSAASWAAPAGTAPFGFIRLAAGSVCVYECVWVSVYIMSVSVYMYSMCVCECAGLGWALSPSLSPSPSLFLSLPSLSLSHSGSQRSRVRGSECRKRSVLFISLWILTLLSLISIMAPYCKCYGTTLEPNADQGYAKSLLFIQRSKARQSEIMRYKP